LIEHPDVTSGGSGVRVPQSVQENGMNSLEEHPDVTSGGSGVRVPQSVQENRINSLIEHPDVTSEGSGVMAKPLLRRSPPGHKISTIMTIIAYLSKAYNSR
jgi:hypothetical protein